MVVLVLVWFLVTLLLVLQTVSAILPHETRFIEWAKENGARFDDVLEWPVEFSSSGRGVRARREIKPQEIFLRLPSSLILNSKTALEYDARMRHVDDRYYLPNKFFRVRSFDRMVMILMRERFIGNLSFWAPYLDILPQANEHGLSEWTEEELNELQNDHILESREVFLEERASCWETITKTLMEDRDAELINETLFEWAFFTIASRSFQLQDNLDEFNMVPVADLLNHDSMSNVSWRLNTQSMRFEMTLLGSDKILPGVEVYNHYGDLSTDRTLLDYAFIADGDNYLEEVTLEMPLDLHKIEEKRDVWDGSELDLDHFTSIKHVLTFFRLIAADRVDPENQSLSEFERPSPTVQLERQALRTCYDVIMKQIPGKTTLEEDERLIKAAHGERRKLALKYRIARKRVYHRYANFCLAAEREILDCAPYRRMTLRSLEYYHRQLKKLLRRSLPFHS